MPPVKGVNKVFSGEAMGKLWGVGEGQKVAVVRSSYPVPHTHQIFPMYSVSVAECVGALIDHFPVEEVFYMYPEDVINPSDHPVDFAPLLAFQEVLESRKIKIEGNYFLPPHDEIVKGEIKMRVRPEYGSTVTVKEAAKLLGVTEDAVRKRVDAGQYEYSNGTSPRQLTAEPIFKERALLLDKLDAVEPGSKVAEPDVVKELGFYSIVRADLEIPILTTGDPHPYAAALVTFGHLYDHLPRS